MVLVLTSWGDCVEQLWQHWSLPEDRLEKVIAEGTTSIADEIPRLKGTWREAEGWQHVIGSCEARPGVHCWRCNLNCTGDPSILRCYNHGMINKDSIRCGIELTWASVCCGRKVWRLWGYPCPLEPRRWWGSPRLQTLNCLYCWS